MVPIVIEEHYTPALVFNEGRSVELLTDVNGGTGELSMQWYKDGIKIPNANKQELNLGLVTPSTTGYYKLIVTDSVGTVEESRGVAITVYPELKVVSASPSDESFETGLPTGSVVELFLEVTGGVPPYTFVWSVNSEEVSRETNAPSAKGVKSFIIEKDYGEKFTLQGKAHDSRDTVVASPVYEITQLIK